MLRLTLAFALCALGSLPACTDGDLARVFSVEKPPVVGRCDSQPGYPEPSQRPGCEYATTTGRGR